MTERRRSGRGVLLLAGEVGITPMRTLFETVDLLNGPVALLYRASSVADVLFEHELREIADRRGIGFRLLLGRSSDPRLALSAANLIGWVPDVAQSDVFICASPRFYAAARAALLDAGVPRRPTHQEEFTS